MTFVFALIRHYCFLVKILTTKICLADVSLLQVPFEQQKVGCSFVVMPICFDAFLSQVGVDLQSSNLS